MTPTIKHPLSNVGALAFYLLISIALFGARVLASPVTAHVGFLIDPAIMIWCMQWWPHAITHELNPFITKVIWAPAGYNLTWATSIPAVAIAFAPITAMFGPVVSYNFAALLAPALSAWAAFILCRVVTRNLVAALSGGAVYGFSPYEVGHVLGGHLSLTPVFIPPLCVFLALALIKGTIGRRGFIAGLAGLLVLQCLISDEVLATMTLFGAIALLAAIVLMPGRRRELLDMIVPIGCAYIAAALILSPFLYFVFAHDAVPHQEIYPAAFFSADLLSFIVPGELMLIHLFGAARVTSRFAGNLWENGSYFSFPLLTVAILYLYPRRREPAAKLLALLLLIIGIAALGPVLHLTGRQIATMPWSLAARLPLLKYALPARFANYGFLVLALILSMWMSGPRVRFGRALAVVVMIALCPNPAFLFWRSVYDVPAFFAQGLYRHYLQPGDNVLVIPYGANGPSMLWQAQSGMYFRMPGGYIGGAAPEDFLRWPLSMTLTHSIPVPDPASELRAFAQTYAIDAIVVADNATATTRQLPMSLGLKAIKEGGVSLYRLPRYQEGNSIARELKTFQHNVAAVWFMQLLCDADRLTAGAHTLAELSPAKARILGLYQDSQWSANLPLLQAGARNGAGNGFWIEPAGDDGTVALGLPVSAAAAGELVSRYRIDASQILFPYPIPYSGAAVSDEALHFLLMNLRPAAFQHCHPGLSKGAGIAVR